MAQFLWTDDLHTGNALIDGDHGKLINRLNALFEALSAAADGQRLAQAMQDLIDYTREHFDREDAEMERIQYVAALAHGSEHVKLLGQLTELQAMLLAGGKINAPAVGDFLNHWLRHHILTADKKLAAALRSETASHG